MSADIKERVKDLLDRGISKKKVQQLYGQDSDEVKQAIVEVISTYQAKTDKQKEAEALYNLVATRLESEFILYMDEKENILPLQRIGDNIVSNSTIKGLKRAAADEMKLRGVTISDSKLEELVKTWQNYADVIKELPKSFTLNPNELTYNRVTIDIQQGPCPTFDNFIERCGENGPALMAYVWSIFEDAEVQQYVLMKGEGKDGKGSLLRLIQKLVGPQAYAGNSVKDDHWVAKLVGKRVGVWSDVNSTAFVMSDLFKQVTGGDRVTVTEKYMPSFSARLDIRIFIATNNDPELTSRKSDLRRIIYVDVAESNKTIPDYEKQLELEAPAILFKCREKFHELYNQSEKVIECDQTKATEKASDFEIEFSGALEAAFELGAEFTTTREAAYNEVRQVFKFAQRFTAWIAWLKRNHGVVETKIKLPGQKTPKNFLKGIRLKHKTN